MAALLWHLTSGAPHVPVVYLSNRLWNWPVRWPGSSRQIRPGWFMLTKRSWARSLSTTTIPPGPINRRTRPTCTGWPLPATVRRWARGYSRGSAIRRIRRVEKRFDSTAWPTTPGCVPTTSGTASARGATCASVVRRASGAQATPQQPLCVGTRRPLSPRATRTVPEAAPCSRFAASRPGRARAGSFTGSVTGAGTGVGRGAGRAGGGRTGSVVGNTSIRRRSGPISPIGHSSRVVLVCVSAGTDTPLVGATHHCLFRSPVAAFSGSAATADESPRCPSAAPLVAVITCRV